LAWQVSPPRVGTAPTERAGLIRDFLASQEVRCLRCWMSSATDPDGDMVIETTVNGGADVIATFNIDDMRAGTVRCGIDAERPAAVPRRLRP
jgi:hypothetical protein